MMGSALWLVRLRPLQRQALGAQRGLKSSAVLLQEDNAPSTSGTSTPPRSLNVVAALRKNIGQQTARGGGAGASGRGRGGDRGQRPQQGGGDRPQYRANRGQQRAGQYGADRPPRRDNDRREGGQRFERREGQGQRGGMQSSRGGRGGRGGMRGGSSSRRNQGLARRSSEEDADGGGFVRLSPTPVQSVYPVTNWQNAATYISRGYTRVPYSIPAVTLELMNAPSIVKIKHKLRHADNAIKLHHSPYGSVMGPINDPTPSARPRAREDDAPTNTRSNEDGSIAQETKEARVKFMQEKFGGDYQRWEKNELLAKTIQGKRIGVVQGHAVEALVRNEDLGPAHKAWTLGTIDTILTGRKASQS